MLLNTKDFGEIEVPESSIIYFEKGLPGFEGTKRYAIIDSGSGKSGEEEEESPFKWMQCCDQPQIAFAVANPFMIKKDYDFEISDENVKSLDIRNAEDVAVYAIVNIPEDISKMSINLKAPVIINARNRRGEQIILDTGKYNVRHYILDEISKQEVAADAGADQEKGSVPCNK
jgi:flagellar assembly factor FliW